MPKTKKFRTERDSLGERLVPAEAYWGIQTLRAKENFPISGIPPKPVFIKASAMVKAASAEANISLGLIDKRRGQAIIKAAGEVISGRLDGQFIVDVYQAGAGTSHNMNANEVIANRAIELLGGKKGDYKKVHPNDHVNMSQSTNDTMPAALRVAALLSTPALLNALAGLEKSLRGKARAFDSILKSGRTHLQDAVPVRLGQEFGSWASSIRSSTERITAACSGLKRIGLGSTATGTGLNTHPRYRSTAVAALGRVSGIKGLRKAPDGFEALNSTGDFAAFSGALRDAAVELVRIANDLRLLGSGPRTGLSEITLPAVQPGSSIMPGKVNPVMAEMLDMVCFQVIGNDLTVALASQAGQLELNVMLPVINYNLLQSMEILASAVEAFNERCVKGIKADRKRCTWYLEGSIGLATILNRFIGYEKAAEVAKESARTGRTVKEITIERGLLTKEDWARLLRPGVITEPFDIREIKNRSKR
ncbi:MAG: aspartate ammonia-lyase, partial [Deltaproteobacteria bacterium]|nr:aspartate ammonia-lyase [Deltaproteobacteria bacterium]